MINQISMKLSPSLFHRIGVNYNPGIWHFPLISTKDMNFLVVDRKGSGDNLVLEDLNKEEIFLKY